MVESSVPRPRVSWSWICSGFPPSWSVLVSVEPPCWCGNVLPLLQQDLAPVLARCWLIIYSLTRQREQCPKEFAWEDMPGAHPHPTACHGVGQLHPGHFCIQATGAKNLDIFFPLTYGSAARFFPSILSLSLPGWLNELFSLLLALTFLCARRGPLDAAAGGSGLAGAAPAGKQELDVHSTGSGWELENCQRWVVFPLLINERKTSSSPLECVFALEKRHAADGDGKSRGGDGLCRSAAPRRLVLRARCHAGAAVFGVCVWGFASSRVLVSVPLAYSVCHTTGCHQTPRSLHWVSLLSLPVCSRLSSHSCLRAGAAAVSRGP